MKIPGWINDENNLAKQASVTGTNPTDSTNYPERNLISLPVSKTLRINNRASNKLHLTFNRAVTADFAALVGHNLSAGATITLRAGATWDASTVSETIAWRRRTAFIYLSASQSYQYWSIEIDDDANENPYLEFGYSVLGILTAGAYGPSDGWSYSDDMIQVRTDSPTGTPDIRALTERQRIEMQFEALSTGEASTIRSLFLDLAGREKPLFFVPDTLVNDGLFGRFEQDGLTLEHINDLRRAVNLTLLEDPAGFSLEAALPIVRSGESLPTSSVFTRASVGWYKNRDLELVSAAIDVLRDPHYLDNGKFGILLEPERVNSWSKSEEQDDAGYTKTRSSITANNTNEPKATASSAADKLVEDGTASSTHYIQRVLATATDNNIQSISLFAKAGERSHIRCLTTDKAGAALATDVDLSDGSIASQNHAEFFVEKYANSWYRIMLSFDVGSGGTTPSLQVRMGSAAGTFSYNGDSSSGLYLWQFQHEVDDSWPSSIIPTTTGSVTRNTDKLQVPLNFGPTPFTGYISYWEIGQNQFAAASGFLLMMGHRTNTTTDPRVLLTGSLSVGARLQCDDGVTSSSVNQVFSSVIADAIELRVVLEAGGLFTLGESVNGSSEDTTQAVSAFSYEVAGAWPEAWMAIVYQPGFDTGGGFALLREFKFYDNEQSQAFMRLL